MDVGTATGSGHGSGDVLSNIENVFGSLFNDDLFGDANDNVLEGFSGIDELFGCCLLYTSPSPRDQRGSRMPSSA